MIRIQKIVSIVVRICECLECTSGGGCVAGRLVQNGGVEFRNTVASKQPEFGMTGIGDSGQVHRHFIAYRVVGAFGGVPHEKFSD